MSKLDHSALLRVKRNPAQTNAASLSTWPWRKLKAELIGEFGTIKAAATFFGCSYSSLYKMGECPRIQASVEKHFREGKHV